MASENIELDMLSGTTAELAALTYKQGLWAWDTTKGHAISYMEDGVTLRHFINADSNNNIINTLGNIPIGDGKYIGFAGAGRLIFDDETTDLITVKSAILALTTIAGDGDEDTDISFSTADKIRFRAGNATFLDFIEDTQDVILFNPDQGDVDFIVNASSLEALNIAGDTGIPYFKGAEFVLGGITPTTGDWKFVKSGTSLLLQEYGGASWATKATFIP